VLYNEPYRPVVTGDRLVGGEQKHAFGFSLRNQDPIERILVEGRKRFKPEGVVTGYRQFLKTVI